MLSDIAALGRQVDDGASAGDEALTEESEELDAAPAVVAGVELFDIYEAGDMALTAQVSQLVGRCEALEQAIRVLQDTSVSQEVLEDKLDYVVAKAVGLVGGASFPKAKAKGKYLVKKVLNALGEKSFEEGLEVAKAAYQSADGVLQEAQAMISAQEKQAADAQKQFDTYSKEVEEAVKKEAESAAKVDDFFSDEGVPKVDPKERTKLDRDKNEFSSASWSPCSPVRVHLAIAAGVGRGLAARKDAVHLAGVRIVLRCIAQAPGGEEVAAKIIAWAGARKTAAEPPRCAEAHALAVALAATEPPEVAFVRAATAHLHNEPGGAQALAAFDVWLHW